jgi:hypothetical protein
MANNQNLRPIKLTHEQATEFGKKGGKASVKAKRKKQTFESLAKMMLNHNLPEDKKELLKEIMPEIDIEEMTYRSAMLAKQIEKAFNGDLNSFCAVRDTAGEMPVKKLDIDANITGIDICFIDNESDDKIGGTDDENKCKKTD